MYCELNEIKKKKKGFTLAVLHVRENLELKKRLINLHSGSANIKIFSSENISPCWKFSDFI